MKTYSNKDEIVSRVSEPAVAYVRPLEYPNLAVSESEKRYTHQEVWEMVEKRLSDHYGVEIKFD